MAAMFAKYDGIEGESEDSNHKGWIDVMAVSWSVMRNEGAKIG